MGTPAAGRVAGSIRRAPRPTHAEISTIGRRLQHASETMGVRITRAFAERMAAEGLDRSEQIGMAKAAGTVIFFAESTDRATAIILGWADGHTCLDRFASLRLEPNAPATAPLDPGPAGSTGPDL